MTYQEAEKYLFSAAPTFQNIGAAAYKPGLQTTLALDAHTGHPHRSYRTIHVGGTNGKGSVAHTLAAILQAAGYRTGLFTSPHLLTFRERIRVNGEMIPEERVVEFVEKERNFFEPLHPSFFELTTALALLYFKEQQVDVAVVEVGLGGRLDCTNIITPLLSIVTNVGLDHTDLLGTTLPEIAREKAGIFKPEVTAVLGETSEDTIEVFRTVARQVSVPLHEAMQEDVLQEWDVGEAGNQYVSTDYGTFTAELSGQVQVNNARTVLTALRYLPLRISAAAVKEGFAHVCALTGLAGRWQTLQEKPHVICDTGHNPHGWRYTVNRLQEILRHHRVHLIFGMAADKDVEGVVSMLPAEATYYFTAASGRRSLGQADLLKLAARYGLQGEAYPDVTRAYAAAMKVAQENDYVFVGGSTFVVADLMAYLSSCRKMPHLLSGQFPQAKEI